MNFVDVISNISNSNIYRESILLTGKITGISLFSLIQGFRQDNFGFDTLQNLAVAIRQFKREFLWQLFIDSGGYSIIRGDIDPKDIPMVIGCYAKYIESENMHFDQIFSLDIPLIAKPEFAAFNTQRNILECNRQSLMASKPLLEDPQIRSKFSFVWHFKTPEHYQIWSHLYDELDLSKRIMRRSIGGMVGLSSTANIRFAPFIAMAYRCLLDHLAGPYASEPFYLHLLGIKSLSDRFAMALMDRLFKEYLNPPEAFLTYDSISETRAMHLKNKNSKVYNFENGVLNRFTTLFDIPDDLINHIYSHSPLTEWVKPEIERLRAGQRMKHLNILSPLGAYSAIQLNRYLEHAIDHYEMANILLKRSSIIQVKHDLKPILNELYHEQPEIFTKSFVDDFIINVGWIFRFSQWYQTSRDRSTLEPLIEDFIHTINFPSRLK